MDKQRNKSKDVKEDKSNLDRDKATNSTNSNSPKHTLSQLPIGIELNTAEILDCLYL